MQKKFVFLLSFLLASMAHAELKVEDQQALVDYAKNLEAKVTKIVDNNLDINEFPLMNELYHVLNDKNYPTRNFIKNILKN